jgi:hypothetical protein
VRIEVLQAQPSESHTPPPTPTVGCQNGRELLAFINGGSRASSSTGALMVDDIEAQVVPRPEPVSLQQSSQWCDMLEEDGLPEIETIELSALKNDTSIAKWPNLADLPKCSVPECAVGNLFKAILDAMDRRCDPSKSCYVERLSLSESFNLSIIVRPYGIDKNEVVKRNISLIPSPQGKGDEAKWTLVVTPKLSSKAIKFHLLPEMEFLRLGDLKFDKDKWFSQDVIDEITSKCKLFVDTYNRLKHANLSMFIKAKSSA